MRICIITSAKFPPEEGIGNYIYNMSREFIRKGHSVTVITRGGIHRTKREKFDGIELYRVPFLMIYPFHVHIHGIFLNRFLKSMTHNFDVINIHTPLTPPIKTNIPIILTVHSLMINGAKAIDITDLFSLATRFQAKYISHDIEKKLIKNSKLITAVSKKVATELESFSLDQKSVIVIYNGVDENVFLPSKIQKKDKYILYTGRISYGKGLFELIDCANEICKSRKDIRFVLAGDGPILQLLKNKAKNIYLENYIEFLGRVDRDTIIKLYQNATIFAFPSYYEGLPGSLLEAMSCKLPIVATKVSGNVELITHEKNGILVPPRNPTALAKAILLLLDNAEMRGRLGENARKTIENGFTWGAISEKILRCYESIAEGRK